MKVVAILGDFHVPYQDSAAVKVALKIVKDVQPDEIVLNGDIIDFYSVSGYLKDPSRINTLQPDIDKTRALIGHMRHDIAPEAKFTYTEGNHENRLKRLLLSKAPELYHLRALTVPELLGLDEEGIKYLDNYQVADMNFIHGRIVRKYSAYTAKAASEQWGNVIQNHTHRLGAHYRTDHKGRFCAYENGCLCSMNVEYIHGQPDWQHGFSIMTLERGLIGVEQIQIRDGVAFFRGRKWTA